jgi:DNA-binding MarR family transcriptional regulator
MQQLDMLTPTPLPRGLTRRTDPETSRIAAERLRASGALGRQAEAVLAAVTRWPGSTAVELARHAQLDRYAVSRRLPELQRQGRVRRGPPRECTVNGRPQSTWRPV